MSVAIDHVLASKTIYEYDERFSSQLKGYTLQQYHHKASCEPHIPGVTVPVLCINSLNDPVSQ